MNRAALIEHERWYLAEREANETDSQNARAVVAFSFADGAVPVNCRAIGRGFGPGPFQVKQGTFAGCA
jgi:hypothetical protein